MRYGKESPMEWTLFKELFLEKYFPVVKQDEKEREFLRLVQRNMSLVEYGCKFDELAHYTPYLVNIEECKARHCEKGLKPELYIVITMLRLPTYDDVF